jgi:hypothetical protein
MSRYIGDPDMIQSLALSPFSETVYWSDAAGTPNTNLLAVQQ